MEVRPSIHPSADVLRAFALGKLNEVSAEVVMNHLDSCADCCQEVSAMTGDDFLARLRQAHGRSSTPAPAKSLTDTTRAPKPSANLNTVPNLPPELANNAQYEVLRELGRGGMGVVYQARHRLSGRLEVLKVMNKELLARPGSRERFLREIQSAARLDHANVVKMYTALELGELMVLVMEYVEGESLADYAKKQGMLPVMHACYYVQQAALGLQHAFENDMVHRDIKPQNLMLARKGKKPIVKVLDFGLAKARREKNEDTGLTGEGAMLGTPDYVAPEQTLDAAKADIRADIYSLGCTLYYLLTGAPPFKGRSLYEVLQAHHSIDAKPLNLLRPEVPEELAAVVRKMMAKDPAKRYQTPAEVVQALGLFGKSGPKSVPTKLAPELSMGSGETAAPERPIKAATAAANREVTAVEAPPPVVWDSLTEDSITSIEPRRSGALRKRRLSASKSSLRKKWLIGGIAACVLLFGLIGLWASGVFKVKTKNGTIVLTNLPPDAEVLVDGEKVIVNWGDGGKKAEIQVKAGTRQVEAKRDGVRVLGEEVTLEEGGRTIITARLDKPPPAPPAGGKPSGDRPAGVSVPIFNGKDLTGWEGLPGYWHVEDGAIVGRCPPGRPAHTFLVSTKTYSDFDLKFTVRRKDGIGNSGVQFRSQIKDRNKFLVVGPQCEIDSADFTYPPGSLVTEPNLNPFHEKARSEVAAKYKDADFNDYHIRCVGKHLTIEVNGVTAIDGDFALLPDDGVIAWQIHGRKTAREITFRNIEFTDFSAPASAEGFVPLFNGKDLAGWKTHPRQPGNWRVVKATRGDVLTGSGPAISHLFTERGDYKNFHLRVEARINDGGNSGVCFRTPFGPTIPANNPRFLSGYEAQINSTHRDINKTGSLYAGVIAVSVRESPVPANEWFTMDVIAEGDHIVIKVNGETTVTYTDEKRRFTSGHIALQQHNAQTVCEFRKIEIKELPSE